MSDNKELYEDGDEEELDEETDRDPELEAQFTAAIEKAQKKIDKLIAKSHEYLSQAEEIAEEYGVPFYSSISPLGQQYQPASFTDMWGELSAEFLEEVGIWRNYDVDCWEYSAVCP